MKPLFAAALLLLATAPASFNPEAVGLQIAHDLAEGREGEVAARFDEKMAGEVSAAKLKAIMDPLREEQGALEGVAVVMRGSPLVLRLRWASGEPSRLSVYFDPDGRVSGLWITPDSGVADESRDGYQTKARLRPPFHGTWTARNADRAPTNPHFTNRAQRFAVDWLITDSAGSSFRGDGKRLSDYYAYGQAALAAADATVVTVVDGIPENKEVGEEDPYYIPGNTVVLDLGGGEFATYCHLIPGSIVVKPGERVKAGQLLAKVGNSGNSSEPHLHFQLSDAARLIEARGLPAKFPEAMMDGKKTDLAWPVTGSRLTGP